MSEGKLNLPDLRRMAESFYGYGHWDAPFWFVGIEPGMARYGDDSLHARCASWQCLGGGELVDCSEHHLGFGFTKWHQPLPPTQPTWRQLIRLLLAYKGYPTTLQAIRAYQSSHWGRSTGETCVIELSGLAAADMRVSRDRTSHLSRRVQRIHQAIAVHRPEFVVFYGESHRGTWETVAGGRFDSDGLRFMGATTAAVARHPVSRGLGNEYWEELGRQLRIRLASV